jgi:signal transduction histidine kinase
VQLDSAVEEHLYRLAQEALHNVVKHASAHHVVVEVGEDADRPGLLVMVIRDDGVGFDTTALNPGHLGLGTMAERAQQIGGSFEILSYAGEGTTVRVEVPDALRGDAVSPEASLTGTA